MPGDQPEVRIRLIVDDQSADTLAKVKEGLKGTGEEAEKAGASTKGMGASAASALGPYLAIAAAVGLVVAVTYEAVAAAHALGEAAVEAASEAYEQERAMAGIAEMMAQGKYQFGDMLMYTESVREELAEVGMEAGVSAHAMGDAFTDLIERQQMSTEKAKELTEQMAEVGKITKGGMSGLAMGFQQMEMGIVRARNPLVQLIAATGVLHGSAKEVAKQMQKMTPEQQMAKAEEAIKKQADMIKKTGIGAPTIGELKTSFEGVRESFLESMGKPMLEALVPHLVGIRSFLLEHIETIRYWGRRVGYVFGEVIDFLASIFGGIYDAINENWDELKGDISDVAQPLVDAWHEIFGNREAFHDTFKHIVVDMIHGFTKMLAMAVEAANLIVSILEHIPGVGKQIKESRSEGAQKKAGEAMYATGPKGDKEFAAAAARYKEFAHKVDEATGAAADVWVQNMARLHEKQNEEASKMASEVQAGDYTQWAAYIQQGMAQHHDAMVKYAVDVLGTSSGLQTAIVEGKINVEGGFNEFIKMLDQLAPELAKKLKDAANVIGKAGGVASAGGGAAGFHMGGGNTFNIKQDFRDADPDRVAFVFRRDMLRAVESRVSSRIAPIGGAF